MTECPKCGGGSFLSEEELVKVIENSDPVKVLIKSIYQCRACTEKFSRLVCDSLDARKKQTEPPAPAQAAPQSQPAADPPSSIQFF